MSHRPPRPSLGHRILCMTLAWFILGALVGIWARLLGFRGLFFPMPRCRTQGRGLFLDDAAKSVSRNDRAFKIHRPVQTAFDVVRFIPRMPQENGIDIGKASMRRWWLGGAALSFLAGTASVLVFNEIQRRVRLLWGR